ncbi:MAG: DUF3179 domain-containing protein [Flavobacteriales bacterium]|nr:DUF3179 domain-containing protein [Flavobacteriales bacterium]
MRTLRFSLGVLLLLVPEVLRVYFIMPFPGSQEDVATDLRQINIAYWLHTNIWWVRLVGLALVLGPFGYYLRNGSWWKRIAVILPIVLCALVLYAFNFQFMADKMFYPPKVKKLTLVPTPEEGGVMPDSVAKHLVIAVELNGDAHAYPIELIGYHHQVMDTIGGEAVMITYCTVCRTGRAFSPIVNGEPETFRLVGMDHYNAMFEDSRTKSWWRQATGECIAGPLKGAFLEEIASTQLTLNEFSQQHPTGLVFQPDSNFLEQYADLKDYDDGTIESSLEFRDTVSWKPKSWVVGVVHNGVARAYDWNELERREHINDTLGGDTIGIQMRVISMDYVGHKYRGFNRSRSSYEAAKTTTVSEWVVDESTGEERLFEISKTEPIPAYQEFWHSWRTFHPNTTRYEPKR